MTPHAAPVSAPPRPVPAHGARVLAELAADRSILLLEPDRARSFFVCPAETVTSDEVNLMATHGRGLICLALPPETVDRLDLGLMPVRNRDAREWRHTVSIEARCNISTGISAPERAHTIRTAASPDATSQDIVSPGHVFPVRPALGPAGRASEVATMLDLMAAAGCGESAVFCMVLNDAGAVASIAEARALAKRLGRVAIATTEARGLLGGPR